MLGFLVRLFGYLFVAAGLVALLLDGARSIANSALMVTPLGETLATVLRERYLALQPAVERLHPVFWDPVVLTLTRVPTALAALLVGFLLLRLGARREPRIGIVTRR